MIWYDIVDSIRYYIGLYSKGEGRPRPRVSRQVLPRFWSSLYQSCTSKGIRRQGLGSFGKEIQCFNTHEEARLARREAPATATRWWRTPRWRHSAATRSDAPPLPDGPVLLRERGSAPKRGRHSTIGFHKMHLWSGSLMVWQSTSRSGS